MCGISGYVARDPKASPDLAAVRRMNTALVHRGPDDEGLWQHGPGALGHRRLSIIDLSPEARQPLVNEDGSVAVVVNGEIYNFATLRDELLSRGHTFRSRSDSEVVVHLYEEYGEHCIAKLQGMFALALWDGARRRLLIARDRAGKKPLFYRRTEHGLAFASEVHALIRGFPTERPSVNYAAIDEYIELGYIPSPLSAYNNVWKLPAAHYAIVSPGELPTPLRYWSKPRGLPLTGNTDDLADELRARLTEAVRRRMVSDVPLGAFLSGGVDSSTVVAMMAGLSSHPIKTFSIGFPQADYSEVGYARMVAQRYHTEHHEMEVTARMVDVVGETVRHHGEPFADSSSIATYYLAKMTREHVTVALSGDAGDENFVGYKRYGTARLGHLHDRLSPRWQRPVARGLTAFGRVFYPYVGRYAARLSEGEASRYQVLVGQFDRDTKQLLYSDTMAAARTDATVQRFKRLLAESTAASAIGRVADLDFNTYLTDDINVKVDIASMAHGLEVRCPFLDTDVVEFAARLPAHLLMRFRGKYLLRRAVRTLVPRAILYRAKRGFGIPLEHWMRHDLRGMIQDVLLDRTARERGIFNPAYVSHLVEGLDTRGAYVDRLWTLLILELWFREFIDPVPVRTPERSSAGDVRTVA